MKILAWFRAQKTHLKTLTKPERDLLLSFFLFALAAPLVYTYTNTLFWRLSHSPATLIVYNLGFYLAISFGFLLNGLLLRWSETPILYLLGAIVQGLVPLSVVLLGDQALNLTFVFGLISGLAAGFYWANRNYLTSKLTSSRRRFYFISMETALGTIASILAPAAIGWFLISSPSAYLAATVIGLVIMAIAGWIVVRSPLPECINPIKRLWLKHPDPAWSRLRRAECFNGMIDGVENVLPIIMILTFLGGEEALGTVNSLSAVIATALIYTAGRRLGHRHYFLLLSLWVVATIFGTATFALLFSTAGVLIYVLVSACMDGFRWTSLATIMYETVDESAGQGTAHRYVYIMDRELFLNGGRVAVLLLLALGFAFVPSLTLRFGLLLILIGQGALLLIIKPLTKHIKNKTLLTPTAAPVKEENLLIP